MIEGAGIDRDATLRLDNQLCFAVYALSREITKRYQPHLKKLGLTYTQYITMLVLWEQDEVTVKQLGARLQLDSGTLTPLLKKLEAMGNIIRTRDKNDERSVVITLTEQGKRLKEDAYEIPLRTFCEAGLTMETANALRLHIEGIVSNLQPVSIDNNEHSKEEIQDDDL